MCGIVAAYLDDVTDANIETIKRVLLETEIRGKHASGISWYDGEKLNCIKKSIPISELLKTFDLNSIVFNRSIRMIAHIRYSTSDIEYNQPIGDGTSYIVHNGVISQADPSLWEQLYKYKCETRNDSELLYNEIKNNGDYLYKYKGCSASYAFIDSTGNIKHGRNSLRPQWKSILPNGYIISSTKNILLRAGLSNFTKIIPDDSKELIKRSMDESYTRIQNIFHKCV